MATKKVVPKILSARVKEASLYSLSWRRVKYNPRKIVSVRLWIASVWCLSVSLWWAHVTVTPEARSRAVFKRGAQNVGIVEMPVGGQQQPISGVGASLLWKKAQKNPRKNITSDKIKRIIPQRRPLVT